MNSEKYVLVVDEETQGIIINSLLLMRDTQLKQGMDTTYIGDVILEICNAPKKKRRIMNKSYER